MTSISKTTAAALVAACVAFLPSQAAAQADQEGIKAALLGAQTALSEMIKLPAAAQLQGDVRTMVSGFISEFNAFATLPKDMPAARQLIDYLRDVNAQSGLQVMCCGGIYKRADGLAEEIGADLFAEDADDAVRIARQFPNKRATAEQQTVGRKRRARKAQEKRARGGVKSPRTLPKIDPHREAA